MKKKITPVNRVVGYDFMRVAAILAVIMVHCVAFVVAQSNFSLSKTWILGDIIDSLCRWCVPVFVMLSGALVIKRPFDAGNIGSFYRSKANRIILPFLFWVFVYIVWYSVIQSKLPWNEDLTYGIREFIAGYPIGYHLYFIQIIIGLYLVTPLISLMVSGLNMITIAKISFWILFASVVSWFISTKITGDSGVNMITEFIPYVGYYMVGFVMGQYREILLAKFRGRIVFFVFIISAFCIMLGTYYVTSKADSYQSLFYDYLSPFVALMSLAVFLGLQKLSDIIEKAKIFEKLMNLNYSAAIANLSNMVFGVYFVHLLLLQMFWLKFSNFKSSYNGVFVAIISFFIIIFFSFILVSLYGYTRLLVIRTLRAYRRERLPDINTR